MKTKVELENGILSLITEMREEAFNLRCDTLVSLTEGFCNEIKADMLDAYANKLSELL